MALQLLTELEALDDERREELTVELALVVVAKELKDGLVELVVVLCFCCVLVSLSVSVLVLSSSLSGFSGSVPSGRSSGSTVPVPPAPGRLNPGGQSCTPKKEGQSFPLDGGLIGPPKPGGPILGG